MKGCVGNPLTKHGWEEQVSDRPIARGNYKVKWGILYRLGLRLGSWSLPPQSNTQGVQWHWFCGEE